MQLFVFSQAPLNESETDVRSIGPYADKDHGTYMANNTFTTWTMVALEVTGETLEDWIASVAPQLSKMGLPDSWIMALASILQNPEVAEQRLRMVYKAILAQTAAPETVAA